MNNMDTPIKMLQLLRINNVYNDKNTAIEALKNICNSQVGKKLEDGTPILARFQSDDEIKSIMGIIFKKDNNEFITIVEGREDLYKLISDLYNITTDLNIQTSEIRDEIQSLHETDESLQEQIDTLEGKKMLIEGAEDNDYITISSSTIGNITTYVISEKHEFDMGTW